MSVIGLARIGRRLQHDDEGVALVAAIGVVVVGVLVGSVILASVVTSVGSSSAARADVQSEAAAQAGITFAASQLTGGSCKSTYTTADVTSQPATGATNPQFSVQVMAQPASTTTWTAGCPTSTSANVRLVSTGTAASKGVAGQSSGNTSRIEAVYSVPPGAPTLIASGAAIYSYSASSFTNAGILSGPNPTVELRTGNVTCQNAQSLAGSIVAASGNLTITNTCSIAGNAWASGSVTLSNSSHVSGSVIAGAGASITSSSLVGGSVWAKGAITKSGGIVSGHLYPNGSAPAAPAMPAVPEWFDYFYDPYQWQGFTAVTLANCTTTGLQSLLNAAHGALLVDARNCANGVTLGNNNVLTTRSDVAIFAPSYTLASGTITSNAPHRLWLITPDGSPTSAPDTMPTCSGPSLPGSFTAGNAFALSNLSAFVYSPCKVSLGNAVIWRGQIYGGQVSVNNAAIFQYSQVGLAGLQLEATTVTPTTASPGGASLITLPGATRDLAPGS